MLIIWLSSLALIGSLLLMIFIENPGFVLIDWFNYQVKIDIIVAIFLAIIMTLAILMFSYLVTKIITLQFPSLAKIFFKKTYIRNVEKLLLRSQKSWSILAELLIAIDVRDYKKTQDLQNIFSKLVKNPDINHLINGKIATNQQNYYLAEKYFNKISHFANLDNLLYYIKFRIADHEEDYSKAIIYGENIVSLKHYDISVAKRLFLIYKKLGHWQDAKKLIAKVGAEKFSDELQKRDVALLNSGYALELYRNKNFYRAMLKAREVMKNVEDFLPAFEIYIKSLSRLSLDKFALRQIKKMWQERPNLILIKLFEIVTRKMTDSKRINEIENLVKDSASNKHFGYLSDVAIGYVALRLKKFDLAINSANKANEKQMNRFSFDILAKVAKLQNRHSDFIANHQKSQSFSSDLVYFCDICSKTTLAWDVKCHSCGNLETINWN